jgi:hypothetical protein
MATAAVGAETPGIGLADMTTRGSRSSRFGAAARRPLERDGPNFDRERDALDQTWTRVIVNLRLVNRMMLASSTACLVIP